MTLIINFVCRPFAVQVSDRRVTANRKVFDGEANKSLIYSGPDALIAVAYTGIAYVGQFTTDEWLADQILGRPYRHAGEGFLPWLSVNRFPSDPRLSAVIYRLKAGIEHVFPSLPPAERCRTLQIGVVGWLLHHGLWLKYVMHIIWDGATQRVRIAGGWRLPLPMNYTWWMSGGWQYQLPALAQKITVGLANPPGSPSDSLMLKADYVRTLLRDIIVEASSSRTEIGPDALSIVLPRPHGSIGERPPEQGALMSFGAFRLNRPGFAGGYLV